MNVSNPYSIMIMCTREALKGVLRGETIELPGSQILSCSEPILKRGKYNKGGAEEDLELEADDTPPDKKQKRYKKSKKKPNLTDGGPFPCDGCDRTFTTKVGRGTHRRLAHDLPRESRR